MASVNWKLAKHHAEEAIRKKRIWLKDRLHDGKQIKKCLPVVGELTNTHPIKPTRFVERIIIPEKAITRTGYVNEIWVPAFGQELELHGNLVFQIVHYCPGAHPDCTRITVYGHPDVTLLPSPKKVAIVPYLCPDEIKSMARDLSRQQC